MAVNKGTTPHVTRQPPKTRGFRRRKQLRIEATQCLACVSPFLFLFELKARFSPKGEVLEIFVLVEISITTETVTIFIIV